MNNNLHTMNNQDMAEIIASVDDNDDNHILWVSKSGNVFISPVGETTPAGWEEKNDDKIRFRWETFMRGNEYCGNKASKDNKYVDKTLCDLRKDWDEGKEGYVDY